MITEPSEPDLTFQWPPERGFPYVLFVCVAGSLLAHAGTFFLFQIVDPHRVTIPQPAPHVSILTPNTPENVALLRWIEAEDPALIATDNSVPPPGLVGVRYVPSFAAPRTAPLGSPIEKSQEVLFPPAVTRLAAVEAVPAPVVLAPATTSATTQIRFAGELATRALVRNPALKAPQLATAPVAPTILLAGVNDNGEIRYQIVQQPCGSPKLDELAISHLRRLSFAAAGAPITWAHVTFAWGADAYAAPENALKQAPVLP
jgi:hypothetical protein